MHACRFDHAARGAFLRLVAVVCPHLMQFLRFLCHLLWVLLLFEEYRFLRFVYSDADQLDVPLCIIRNPIFMYDAVSIVVWNQVLVLAEYAAVASGSIDVFPECIAESV